MNNAPLLAGRSTEYHHFVAPIEMNGSDYRVMITAREKVNSNTLYVVKTEVLPTNEKRDASLAGQTPPNMIGAPRTMSIADLVNGVNIYDYETQQNVPYTEDDISFSLSKTVEETKDLVAVHNLNASELVKTIELDGLPMPSIAVVKAKSGHDKYGDYNVYGKDVRLQKDVAPMPETAESAGQRLLNNAPLLAGRSTRGNRALY